MMEVENLAEYRSLLRERNNASWFKKAKLACMRQPTERKIIAAMLVSLSIGVTFIALRKSVADSIPDPTLNTDEEYWAYNSTEERDEFLRLWNNANETLSEILGNLAEQENGKYDLRSVEYAHCELILETVKRSLKKCVSLQILPPKCKKLLLGEMQCPKGPGLRYRKPDGSCNNLKHNDYGMTGMNFNRWLKPEYTDDVSVMRQSVYGGELPSVRHLSNLLFSHKHLPDGKFSMFFVHFGLFLDHDIVATGQTKGNLSSCCLKDPTQRHPMCLRMDIAEDDPLYGPLNVTCKGFLRSPPFTGSCPGRREQQNKMTAFIDMSDMYGSSHEEARRLRLLQKGMLRYSTPYGKPLLPTSPDSGSACYAEYANYSCFLSGDVRVNLLMPLMAMHTIWLREHNRIAAELSILNPQWDDETLYQEARRITIAEYQHITYSEFLPMILGEQTMVAHALNIVKDVKWEGYDDIADAGVMNAFATGAFRFAHSLIQSHLQFRDENYNLKSEIPLHETFLNPTILYQRGLDDVLRGMIGQNTQTVDHYETEEVRGRLLQKFSMTNGYDLTAMTFLRGRDHGIPPYLKWRKFCRRPVPNNWEDMKTYMDPDYVEKLKSAYRSIEDVDLAAAGIGERPDIEGAIIGPTYACMLGHQFSLFRRGDRYWYENPDHPGAFTKDQLREIYKITHARIICDNSDEVKKVPKNIFYTPSPENPIVRCDRIPKMDLSHWKEM